MSGHLPLWLHPLKDTPLKAPSTSAVTTQIECSDSPHPSVQWLSGFPINSRWKGKLWKVVSWLLIQAYFPSSWKNEAKDLVQHVCAFPSQLIFLRVFHELSKDPLHAWISKIFYTIMNLSLNPSQIPLCMPSLLPQPLAAPPSWAPNGISCLKLENHDKPLEDTRQSE